MPKGKKVAKKDAKGAKKDSKEKKSKKSSEKESKSKKGKSKKGSTKARKEWTSPFRPDSVTDAAWKLALKGAKIKDIEKLCKKGGKPSSGVINRLKKGKVTGSDWSWKVKADEKKITVMNAHKKK
jgi:hypothetical protein